MPGPIAIAAMGAALNVAMGGAKVAFDKTTGTVSAAAGTLSKALLGPVNPLNVLNGALNASTSGLSQYMGAVKVLTNLLGGLFAPILLTASSYVLAFSRYLADKVIPVIGDFAAWMSDGLDPVIEGVVSTFNILIDAIGYAYRAIRSVADPMIDLGRQLFALIGRGANALGINTTPGEVTDAIRKARKDVSEEYKRANSAPAQRMGLLEASRNAQMRALNVSPYERENAKNTQATVKELEKLNVSIDEVKQNGRGGNVARAG